VIISYDARARQVWIDALGSEIERSAQLLCEQHRSRLVPPRGWEVVDRRPDAPAPEPPLVRERRPRRERTRTARRHRTWGQLDAPRLEFSGPEIATGREALVRTSGAAPERAEAEAGPGVQDPHAEGAVDPASEEVVAREEVAAEDAAPASDAVPTGADVVAEDSTEAPRDDLASLLAPKGGLLGRAFGATGPQRSALTDVTPDT
jgi:hypothetical protein